MAGPLPLQMEIGCSPGGRASPLEEEKWRLEGFCILSEPWPPCLPGGQPLRGSESPGGGSQSWLRPAPWKLAEGNRGEAQLWGSEARRARPLRPVGGRRRLAWGWLARLSITELPGVAETTTFPASNGILSPSILGRVSSQSVLVLIFGGTEKNMQDTFPSPTPACQVSPANTSKPCIKKKNPSNPLTAGTNT